MPKIDHEIVMGLVQQNTLPFNKEDEDLVRWWCEMAPTVIQEELQVLKKINQALVAARTAQIPPGSFLWVQVEEDATAEFMESIQDVFSSLPEEIAGKIIITSREVDLQTLTSAQLEELGLTRISNDGQERPGEDMDE